MLAEEIMTTKPECVHAGDAIEHAARIMRDVGVGLVPVVDGGDRLVGIVSQADLAVDTSDGAGVARMLEAISEPARPTR